MPSEYQAIPMRVKSVLRDPDTWSITLTLELDNATPRDMAICEKAVTEGATVDVVVSKEV